MTGVFAALLLLGAQSGHPCDPWIVRSAFADRPRAVVIALHEELWVAYDAANCVPISAWRGGQGSPALVPGSSPQQGSPAAAPAQVFQTNPPRTYADYAPGAAWSVTQDNASEPIIIRFRGYVVRGGRITFRYSLIREDGQIDIEESPEFSAPDDAHPALTRRFIVNGLSSGAVVRLRVSSTNTGEELSAQGVGRLDLVVDEKNGDTTNYLQIDRNGMIELRTVWAEPENR